MWNGYYEMKDLDTIYVGSSICQSTFKPSILDEQLGTKSYNMGTPAQPIDLTYVAVKTAIEEHDIESVIFGFGYFTFSTKNSRQAEAAFLQARNQHLGLWDRLTSNLEYMLSKENIGESVSINIVFPWVNNHVKLHAGEILNNINQKINGAEGEETDSNVERGYQAYTGVMNYDEIGDKNTKSYYQPEFFGSTVNKMKAICKLCQENDVELIVVNTPRPVFDITSYGEEYYTTYLWLKDFFEEQGASYYDFNLAKPEIFVSKPEYYYNFEHLNDVGATAFCNDFSEFLKRRENGEDFENSFYNWEEYLESVDDTINEDVR